jgi:N-acetylglucosamine kinase-like BadF-type ATPase
MPSARDAANLQSDLVAGDVILAVDAGGTKTAAWLVEILDDGSHRRLAEACTSAGNPLSVGFDNSARVIEAALHQVLRQSQLTDSKTIGRAVLSIAGAANREMAKRFVAWARNLSLAGRIAIVSDVLPILAAGTPDCCGVALISGTGSSAFGRAADGRTSRCGGWGYLLGDEGSGYAIGRAALQVTLHCLEKGEPRKGLADAILNSLGATSVTELTSSIYSSADPRHAIAALAAIVSTSADNDDPVACHILDDAAADLAALAARTSESVGLETTSFPVAASGGVFVNSKRLQNRLQVELRSRNFTGEVSVIREPLAGCVRLAEPKFADVLVTWHSL